MLLEKLGYLESGQSVIAVWPCCVLGDINIHNEGL